MFRMPEIYRHLYPASWGVIRYQLIITLSMILRENFSELTLVKQNSCKGWNSGTWGEETRQQKRESGKTWGHSGHSLFASRPVPNEPISWRRLWARGSWSTWSWQVSKPVIPNRITMGSITSKLYRKLREPENGGTSFQTQPSAAGILCCCVYITQKCPHGWSPKALGAPLWFSRCSSHFSLWKENSPGA